MMVGNTNRLLDLFKSWGRSKRNETDLAAFARSGEPNETWSRGDENGRPSQVVAMT
jgi:hypothetical protein